MKVKSKTNLPWLRVKAPEICIPLPCSAESKSAFCTGAGAEAKKQIENMNKEYIKQKRRGKNRWKQNVH